jgi:cytoskeletal protein CcmA (bactofilin family)
MESADKKPDEDKSEAPAAASPAQPAAPQAVPEDALEKTNEELGDVVDATGAIGGDKPVDGDGKPPKKPNALKAFFKKVNVYLLLFVLIIVIAGATSMVSYLNSKKAPKEASVASQQLTSDALKKLASSDTTIGNAAQTLTVQGNAIFSGQVLVRSDLSVAGNIQLGGSLQAPSLTVSGKTNLADTQINSLQVAQNVSIQGSTTVKDLNVAGTASFSGPVTASQITVTKLIISGNGSLQVPNHISFTGASPGRSSIGQAALGAGGTASINGSDTSGSININSGSGPAPGCFISLTFNQSFTNTPHVLISPINAGAGSLDYYATKTTTGFSVCTNNAAPGNQVFAFDYFVTN